MVLVSCARENESVSAPTWEADMPAQSLGTHAAILGAYLIEDG